MRLEYLVLLAYCVDLVFGDPRWFPHPVKLIGQFAAFLEAPLRRFFKNPRVAGIFAVILVLLTTAFVGCSLVEGARVLHPVAGDVVSVLLLYTCFAGRDLALHSDRVYRALAKNDLLLARERVAMLVGRDTARLSEPEIVRAAVESVAENMVDGVTAPIFFAILAGPIGALLYKAVNTLDSTFGYKNERYLQFGWASARLDDVANYIPARLTAPLIAFTSALLGYNPLRSWRVYRHDGRKHPSPNSGLSEAAVAGALGVQLGGRNYYFGEPSDRPCMGDSVQPLQPVHILRANRLMLLTSTVALLVFAGIRFAITKK